MIILPLLLIYIIGSIPFGYVIAKGAKHIDIRTHGSGNIGATNVARTLGFKWGVSVFICDFLKGLIAPLLTGALVQNASPVLYIGAGLCAVIGHNWPLFLQFKGGKGVATSTGVVVGLCIVYPGLWVPLMVAFIGWGGIFLGLRVVSMASLTAAVLFFLTSLFVQIPLELKIFSFVICVFIIIRHKKNIYNLLHRKELKF